MAYYSSGLIFSTMIVEVSDIEVGGWKLDVGVWILEG
jgi:hypothetical protein